MHFSSPSGQRLSWWRPWNRGAVGIFSKGYCSVTTFLNMVRKVTPNPATGSRNCSLRERDPELWSPIGVPFVVPPRIGAVGADRGAGVEGQRRGATAHGSAGGHRRDREAPGAGVRAASGAVGGCLVLARREEHQDHEDPEHHTRGDEEVLP